MHRVVGVIAEGDSSDEARSNAAEFLGYETERGTWIDWWQGVKESERWDLKTFPDKPILLTSITANTLCKKLIKNAQDDFDNWFKKGLVELKEQGKKNLENTCINFRLASGGSSCWLFDYTGWGGGTYLRDHEELARLKKYLKKDNKKAYLCLFDTHN